MSGACLSANCGNYLSGPVGQTFTSALNILFAAQCMLVEDWPEDSSDKLSDLTFDYIVVGAGSAGSVVASRLSEDKPRRVLLMEAGGDPPLESQVVSGSTIGTKHDWRYRTEKDSNACLGSKDGRCIWPRGKMLGGSSSINEMQYCRGHYKNYDDLETNGNTGWNSDVALEYFKKSENLTSAKIENDPIYSKYHNYNGLLDVSSYNGTHPFKNYLLRALQEIGSDEVKDIGDLNPRGTIQVISTIKNGERESTATAFLVPANDRENLVLLKNALATKILFNNHSAYGVNILLYNGSEITVKATKEIIVSAGVVNTPQLLMLSGVGPKKHLEDLDIPVIADLAVGENLHDHLTLPTPILLKNKTFKSSNSQKQDILDVTEYLTSRTGAFAQRDSNEIASFFRVTNDSSSPPDIQFEKNYFFKNSSGVVDACSSIGYDDEICNFYANLNLEYDILFILNMIINVKSRGHIELASKNPLDSPKIYPNYFTAAEDIENMIKGIDIISRLVDSPTMKDLGAEVPRVNISSCNNLIFNTKDYWKCIILHLGLSSNHQMGTAKMGPASDPKAVVGPDLRVHGVRNLRVVDASVFPTTISCNINAPTIMLAERASDLIKESYD